MSKIKKMDNRVTCGHDSSKIGKIFHLKYHMKNCFRIGVMCVACWVIFLMFVTYFVPYMAGYLALQLQVTYESNLPDIAMWGFCSLFSTASMFTLMLFLIKKMNTVWNGFFVKTIAEGKMLKQVRDEQDKFAIKKMQEKFGVSKSDT